MNELTIFNNPEFGKIRGIEKDGEPWFVGKDVAEALGYKNTRQALSTNVDDEDKGVHSVDTPSGEQSMTIINESGLYSLVLSSKLPNAKKFKRWITSEVIPSIRKTGGYMQAARPMSMPEMLLAQAQLMVDHDKRLSAVEENQTKVIAACSVPALGRDEWQDGMKKYLAGLCEEAGLNYSVMYGDLYTELENKMGCDLEARQRNLRRRLKAAGATYREQQSVSKLSVIAGDKTLVCAFEGIVQRYAANLAARRWKLDA